MGQQFDKALKLISDDKLDEAEALADEIDEVISDLEDDRDLIYEILERKRGPSAARPNRRKVVKPKAKQQLKLPLDKDRKPRLRVVANEDRSDFIKRFVAEMISKPNGTGKLVIKDIVDAITAAGYDLGTVIPGTVIANVLMKDQHWDRVGQGTFKYLGQQQP